MSSGLASSIAACTISPSPSPFSPSSSSSSSVLSHLKPFDVSRRHCAGFNHTYSFSTFGSQNAASVSCYCRYCVVTRGVSCIVNPQLLAQDPNVGSSCRTIQDKQAYIIERDDFQVWITGIKQVGSPPMLVARSAVEGFTEGFGVVAVPTYTEYEIQIANKKLGTYFRVDKVTVGDKAVIINKGDKVFHTRPLTIDGFESGKSGSFQFISASEDEKTNRPGLVSKTHNASNIIKVTLSRYNCIPAPVMTYSTSFSFGGGSPPPVNSYSQTRGGGGGGVGFGFGGFGDTTLSSKPGSAATKGSLFGFGSSASLSGGATEAGAGMATTHEIVETRDRFDPLGKPIDFTVQLVCTQSEAEKDIDNKTARVIKTGYFTHKKQLEKAFKEMEEARKRMNEVVAKLWYEDIPTENIEIPDALPFTYEKPHEHDHMLLKFDS